MTRRIPLGNRRREIVGYVLVDEDDHDYLRNQKWFCAQGYAVTGKTGANGQRLEAMHRLIMGLDPGDERVVDHINGDKLDNRQRNLRVVSRQQNCQNRGLESRGSSRYRGVTYFKRSGKWRAQARANGKLHHLGYYEDENEAGRVAAAFYEQHVPFRRQESVTAPVGPGTDDDSDTQQMYSTDQALGLMLATESIPQ